MKIAPTLSRVTGLLALAVFLSGCFVVEDVREVWETASLDPALEGVWKIPGDVPFNDEFLNITKKDGSYSAEIFYADPSRQKSMKESPSLELFGLSQLKTIRKGDATFVLSVTTKTLAAAKKKSKFEGELRRYTIQGDKLVLYDIDKKTFEDAVQNGEVTGGASLGFGLKSLDEKTWDFLVRTAAKPECWTIEKSAVRVDGNVQDAVKHSATYPSTEATAANARVPIDIPELDYFVKGHAEILLRQICADRRWRVTPTKDGVECIYMPNEGDPPLWKHEDKPGGTGLAIHFTRTPHEALRGVMTLANPLDKEAQLNLELPELNGIRSSLEIGGEGLWFEISEYSPVESREHTRDALQWLRGYLVDLHKDEDEVKKNGFVRSLLPKNKYRLGQMMEVVADGSYCCVTARFNPGEKGRTYFKIYDADTGAKRKLQYAQMDRIVGWSPDPEELFFYVGMGTFDPGRIKRFYNVRFELWFAPENHSPERKVLEMTCKVKGRGED